MVRSLSGTPHTSDSGSAVMAAATPGPTAMPSAVNATNAADASVRYSKSTWSAM